MVMTPFQLLVACWFIGQTVVMMPITAASSVAVRGRNGDESSKSQNMPEDSSRPPIMYTYFENLEENDFSGMSLQDHHDMLQFWNETWRQAGWQPIILTREDATMNEHHDIISINKKYDKNFTKLPAWTKMLLSRWMAVAQNGGGWYCDYDVFPLYSYSELVNKSNGSSLPPLQVVSNDILTLHEVVAPTLVSGSALAWENMAKALMKHALHDFQSSSNNISNHKKQARKSFWTDTLALLDIRHERLLVGNNKHQSNMKDRSLLLPELRTVRHVVQADRVMDLLVLSTTAIANATSSANRCSNYNNSSNLLKKIKKQQQWVIHFGPLTLQRAPNTLPTGMQRIPSHRLQLARTWMQQWWECRKEAQKGVLVDERR